MFVWTLLGQCPFKTCLFVTLIYSILATHRRKERHSCHSHSAVLPWFLEFWLGLHSLVFYHHLNIPSKWLSHISCHQWWCNSLGDKLTGWPHDSSKARGVSLRLMTSATLAPKHWPNVSCLPLTLTSASAPRDLKSDLRSVHDIIFQRGGQLPCKITT